MELLQKIIPKYTPDSKEWNKIAGRDKSQWSKKCPGKYRTPLS
jgi:hypothetical protein